MYANKYTTIARGDEFPYTPFVEGFAMYGFSQYKDDLYSKVQKVKKILD